MMRARNIELRVVLTGLWALAIFGISFSSVVAQEETFRAPQETSGLDSVSGRGSASLGAPPIELEPDVSENIEKRPREGVSSQDVSGRSQIAQDETNSFPDVPMPLTDDWDNGSGEEMGKDASSSDIEDPVLERNENEAQSSGNLLAGGPAAWFTSDGGWFGREGLGPTLKTILVMSILTLAPAILLMTTSYVRVSVVLLLLRQALGAGQIPSNQVIATLSIFLTLLIMSPVGIDVYQKAVVPYSENQISHEEAFQIGQEPIRTFLWKQIERTGNVEMIGIFTRYLPDVEEPQYYEDVPWRALAPAFLLSELKTAFLIGFQIFLPFLIIDLVVSCVLVSTGMMMLPPAIVSLPFKLALFVMVDGWSLVVTSLLESFA